jgi:membrane associated rhomboid family serine protease
MGCRTERVGRIDVIPIRDINPVRRAALVTYGLIAVNIVVFLYEVSMPSTGHLGALASTWGLVPYRLTGLEPMAFASVFTSMFLHSGWLHLLGNMLYLWIFGDNIENALGSLRFLLFYMLCGIGAALGQVLIDPTSRIPMIGASGAVSGVLGAYLLLYPRAEVDTLLFVGFFARRVRLPAVTVLGWWIVIQLLSGLASLGVEATGGVAWFAHVGGFAAGLLLACLLRRRRWWE